MVKSQGGFTTRRYHSLCTEGDTDIENAKNKMLDSKKKVIITKQHYRTAGGMDNTTTESEAVSYNGGISSKLLCTIFFH